DATTERYERPGHGRWSSLRAAVRPGRPFDAQRGQVHVVAVGELPQALEVELAEESALPVGDRSLAEVDDLRRGRLVVGNPGEQENQPGRRLSGRRIPVSSLAQRDPFFEVPSIQAIPAGQQARGS